MSLIVIAKLALEASLRAADIKSFEVWLNHVFVHSGNKAVEYHNSLAFGPTEKEGSSSKSKRPASAISTDTRPAKSKQDKPTVSDCNICGRRHGGECMYKNCEWANHTSSPWATSVQGIKFKKLNYDFLPKSADPPPRPKDKPKDKTAYQGNYNLFCHFNSKQNSPNTFFTTLINDRQEVIKEETEVLVDQGADNNFISNKLAAYLFNKAQTASTSNKLVCSGIKNNCVKSNQDVIINLQFYDSKDSLTKIELRASVIDTDFELIIGRPTIIKYNFVILFPSFFMSKELEATLLPSVSDIGEMLKVPNQKRRRAEEQETQIQLCNCLRSK